MDFLFGTSAEYQNQKRKDVKRDLFANAVIAFVVIRGVTSLLYSIYEEIQDAKTTAEYEREHPEGPTITGKEDIIEKLNMSYENYDELVVEFKYRVDKLINSGLLNEEITDDTHVVELGLDGGDRVKLFQYSIFFTMFNVNYLVEWFKFKKLNDRRQTYVFRTVREVFDVELSDIQDDYKKRNKALGLSSIIEDNRPYQEDIPNDKKIAVNDRFKIKDRRLRDPADDDFNPDDIVNEDDFDDDGIGSYEEFHQDNYDPIVASDLMNLCKKVYETNNFDDISDDVMHLSHDGESNGFISWDETHKEIIICFKGSETRNDWLHNFNTLTSNINDNLPEKEHLPDEYDDVLVHKGIYNLVSESYNQIIHKFGAYRIFTAERVYITGHSQGGVEALICAYLLQAGGYAYPTVYSFASPQAFYGTNGSSELSSMDVYNIQHNLDLVPLLPQLRDPLLNIQGWHHIGTIVLYDATNNEGSYTFNEKYELPVNDFEWNKKYRDLHGADYYLSLLTGENVSNEDEPQHFTNYIDAVQMTYLIKNFTALTPIGLVNYDEQTLPSYIIY